MVNPFDEVSHWARTISICTGSTHRSFTAAEATATRAKASVSLAYDILTTGQRKGWPPLLHDHLLLTSYRLGTRDPPADQVLQRSR